MKDTPITINRTMVKRVNSFRFLGVHITKDLTWSYNIDTITAKWLFFLCKLRRLNMDSRTQLIHSTSPRWSFHP